MSTSTAIGIVNPPPSVVLNAYQSDTGIRVFDERTITLSASLPVDNTLQGTLVSTSQLTPSSIPTGTTITSRLIHFDTIIQTGTTLSGIVRFNQPIAGLIVLDGSLDASDASLGAPGTTYPTPGLQARGLELDGSGDDRLTIGCDTLDLSLTSFDIFDHIRVITAPGLCPTATQLPNAVAAVNPPPSVVLNAYQSDTGIRVFDERTVTLSAALAVDYAGQGTFVSTSQLTPSSIPTGTTITSRLIHFDTIIQTGTTLSGIVRFNQPIAGLIVLDGSLDASDASLGAPGTTYPTPGLQARGLELDGSGDDRLTIGCDTLDLSLTSFDIFDHIRVITAPGLCPTATRLSGAVAVVNPPPSVIPNAYPSDTEIRVFDERTVTLSAPLFVDSTQQGTFTNTLQLTRDSIPAGITVESHLVHMDSANGTGLTLSGAVRFDHQILGLILSDAGVNSSDNLLGAPNTAYPTGMPLRGIDFYNDDSGDLVMVSCDTLQVRLVTALGLDHIRVVTGPNTCSDLNTTLIAEPLSPAPSNTATP